MRQVPRSTRSSRRRFLVVASGAAAAALLAACSRGGERSTAIPSPQPSMRVPSAVPTSAVPTAAPPLPPPSLAAPSAPLAAIDVATRALDAQRRFVSPLDPAWSYSRGPWARLPHPDWPTDRMAAVMSDAWVRSERVLKGGIGRRCAIATSSPFATLLAEGDGQSLSASLDGGTPVRIGPLPKDGSRVEVPLFVGRAGTTRIELIFDGGGANDGLFVAPGATVSPVPVPGMTQRRLVALGNGYAAGVGASAPGVTGCTALIGDLLKMEAISQGWGYTDVDVRSGEPGNPPNSGLDRVATDAIALEPDAILLVYGLQAVSAPRASWEYSYHYAQLLRAMRTALPGVPIFCSGFPPCNEDLSAAFVQEWNAALRSAANTVDDCPFIEAAGWWEPTNYAGGAGPIYVGGDRTHPNDAGHRFLADRYAAAIAPSMG